MTHDQPPPRRWSKASGGSQNASSIPAALPRSPAAVEVLESRLLLSATAINPGGPIMHAPAAATTANVGAKGYGVTLNVRAGQTFNDYLGDLVGAKLPKGFVLSASVNWGDGTQTGPGKASIGSTGNIDVSGSHAYAKAGKYIISITVTATPGPAGTTNPVTEPIILFLGSIQSTAVVSSTTGGVTINEKAGVAFNATVGTFSFIAPATGLLASINWGDGTVSSAGTITSTGVSGVDVINFKVAGSHTYAKAGTYPIILTVTQSSGPSGSAAPVKLIATIDSTAIVAASGLNLNGTITGMYIPAPTAVGIGARDVLKGIGNAGALGPVSASGYVQYPPFLTTGPVNGSLTLTSISATSAGPSGSVTLTLSGPAQPASDPIPATLSYVVTSGTGSFANATGLGTLDETFGSGLTFTIVIHSD